MSDPQNALEIVVTGSRLPRLHASPEAIAQLKREETGGVLKRGRLVLLPLGQPALTAYQDIAGVWTCGWGCTGKDIFWGVTWTYLECEIRLEAEVRAKEAALRALLPEGSTSGAQFDALLLLVFNIGIAAFKSSTLLRKHLKGDFPGAAQQFDRWVYAKVNGKPKVVGGLVERRKRERATYEAGILRQVALMDPLPLGTTSGLA